MSTVFLFSGQGSQYPGMGRALVEAYPKLAEIYTMASSIVGFDIREYCFVGTAEDLSQTIISQPCIMATSLIAFEAAKHNGITATAVAGHSLGEYAAMVASGMLSFEDGFKVIKARSRIMQEVAEANPGSMCAIIGKTAEEVDEICSTLTEYAAPVNYNSPSQTVIAGTDEGIDEAIKAFTEKGAKAIKLNVNAAFHSKMMKPAAEDFYNEIRDVHFEVPECQFFSNLYGDELTDFSDMPEILSRHIMSPVKFTSELEKLSAAGYDKFVECGPGKVLTGLVKKTLKGATALNIEDFETLKKAMETINA